MTSLRIIRWIIVPVHHASLLLKWSNDVICLLSLLCLWWLSAIPTCSYVLSLCHTYICYSCSFTLIFVRTFLWLCDACMSMWNLSPWRWCISAGKQLAINQPVLTDKELEIVNSIVWRLLLTLTMAVPISDTPERAYETY